MAVKTEGPVTKEAEALRKCIKEPESSEAEHKRAKEDLREDEEVLRSLFDGSPLLDREGTVIMINATGARNMGLSPQSCVGKSIIDLVPGLDESYYEMYQQVVDTGIEATKDRSS